MRIRDEKIILSAATIGAGACASLVKIAPKETATIPAPSALYDLT